MIYPSMALFSHSCCPNTEALCRTKHGLALSSTRPIKKGEELTLSYTSLWMSPSARKEDLTKNWFFTCACERCRDETDFGSNLDTVICTIKDCGG